jgi:hypothetical protein
MPLLEHYSLRGEERCQVSEEFWADYVVFDFAYLGFYTDANQVQVILRISDKPKPM